jgi:hypothetical protein
MNTASACRCGHHKVFPIIVILFGLLFLLEQLGVFTAAFTDLAWPVLVILAGLVKLKSGSCGCYAQAS